MRSALLFVLFASTTAALAQTSAAGANWQRVQQLPVGTKVHVAADSKSRVCAIQSVTEDSLTCSKGRLLGAAHYTFARTEIRSVKLTRYLISTAAGAGIGAAVGGIASVATIRGGTFIDFSGEARAIVTVVSAVAGGLVAGPTDLFRGPTVYRRP